VYGKTYTFVSDFWDGWEKEVVEYDIEEGNRACDCAIADMLREYCDKDFPELNCGSDPNIQLIEMEFI
jgi:hypothetical protein